MSGSVRVFTCVLIRGAIAAQRHTALLACPQVKPARADLYALGALENFRLFHRIDGIEMSATAIRHDYFRLLVEAKRR